MTPPARFAECDVDTDIMSRLASYAETVTHLCTTDEALTCGPDLYNLLKIEHFDDCNVHPNSEGHKVIADEIIPLIEGLHGNSQTS